MVKDKIALKDIKGWITIWGIDKDGNKHLLVDQKNTLVLNAKTIIANTLGGTPAFYLDLIFCYKASAPLAGRGTVVTYPSADSVKFASLFDESSFNDTLDEVRLRSFAGGEFSAVTGLSVLKDNTLQLSIEWLLTIV